MLAMNLTFCRANGAIVDKESFLAGLGKLTNAYETLEQRDIIARVYDDVGVLTLLVHAQGMRGGRPFDGVFRNIRIFLQEPDKEPRWQLHSWFNAKIP
jgi:Domain of unknown function (DUF4440)